MFLAVNEMHNILCWNFYSKLHFFPTDFLGLSTSFSLADFSSREHWSSCLSVGVIFPHFCSMTKLTCIIPRFIDLLIFYYMLLRDTYYLRIILSNFPHLLFFNSLIVLLNSVKHWRIEFMCNMLYKLKLILRRQIAVTRLCSVCDL